MLVLSIFSKKTIPFYQIKFNLTYHLGSARNGDMDPTQVNWDTFGI